MAPSRPSISLLVWHPLRGGGGADAQYWWRGRLASELTQPDEQRPRICALFTQARICALFAKARICALLICAMFIFAHMCPGARMCPFHMCCICKYLPTCVLFAHLLPQVILNVFF